MSANIYTGFPLAQKERLLHSAASDGIEEQTTQISFCEDEEACEEAINLIDTLLSGYLPVNEDDIKESTLDKYNLYLNIVASIVYTLNENGSAESFRNPRRLPKYITETQFRAYLNTTYINYYTLAGVNVQHSKGILKGIETSIRICMEMYNAYTQKESPKETIYTPLLEHRFPPNRNINNIRIYPFPSIDDYIHFIEGEYEEDILLIPTKYRYMLYDKDATIKSLTERVNIIDAPSDSVSDEEQPDNQTEEHKEEEDHNSDVI